MSSDLGWDLKGGTQDSLIPYSDAPGHHKGVLRGHSPESDTSPQVKLNLVPSKALLAPDGTAQGRCG